MTFRRYRAQSARIPQPNTPAPHHTLRHRDRGTPRHPSQAMGSQDRRRPIQAGTVAVANGVEPLPTTSTADPTPAAHTCTTDRSVTEA